MRKKYDANLIVIGAGSGGLVCAIIAAAIKAKVILIEKNKMGGDCLNTGCVPSKALIASTRLIHQIKHADQLGLKKIDPIFDFAEIMERVQTVIAKIEPHDSIERFTQLGVDVIQGEAQLTSPTSVSVNGQTLNARSIIIATGAAPFVPPIENLDQIKYLTSENIWSLRQLPEKLAILGGGPIGCELAQCFARCGSQVSVIEMLPQIMIREDPEIAAFMASKLTAEGVQLKTGYKAIRIDPGTSRHQLVCEHDGREESIEFDQILVAVGRAARIKDYGLEQLAVPISARRTLEVNDYLQAGYPSLYACGDVVGPYQFTHVASHQAWTATVNALFRPFKRFKIDYAVIPWATYTDPEVGRVGLNETDAKELNTAYEVTEYQLSELDRAITEGRDEGKVKILTKPGTDRILGVTIVGDHAGDLIAEFALAMRHRLGLNKILQTVHAYPTWSEANKFVAGQWKREHAPQWALSLLERFHRMRLS